MQRRLKHRGLAYILGPGLFSAAAGFEVSNLSIFALAGLLHGARMLWAVLLSLMIASIMQQMAAVVGIKIRGGGLLEEIYKQYGRLALIPAWSLYAANMATAIMNAAGLAVLLAVFAGIGWRPALLIVMLASWILTYSAENRRNAEKILLALSIVLLVFVAAALRDPPSLQEVLNGLRVSLPEGRDDALLIIAVFGASAAPYSLVLQADSLATSSGSDVRAEMLNVGVGMMFSLLIGASILLAAPSMIGGCRSPLCLVGRSAAGLPGSSLIMIGVMASGLLAITAIIMVNASFRHPAVEAEASSYLKLSGLMLTAIYMASLAMLSVWSPTRIIEAASIVVSMTAWIPGLAVYLLYRENAGKIAGLLGGAAVAVMAGVNLLALTLP